MAADIIPIQLSLTQGDGVTLWAPRWTEDGEEWEAFLGHGENLYVLPDAAHLAAFIRSDAEHDLTDHPAWPIARRLLADELEPDDDHRFDIVGIPELVSAPPDVWSLAELSDTVAILHSLADVCDLAVIDEILGASSGFAQAAQGPTAFIGRSGKKLWHEVGSVVADRWDSLIEALDAIVVIPDVDPEALAAAQAEIAAVGQAEHAAEGVLDDESAATQAAGSAGAAGAADESAPAAGEEATDESAPRDADLEFWDEVGIDCIAVTCDGRTGWTLRCYLDDAAAFLSVGGRIQLYPSPAALEDYLSDPTADNALSRLDAWTTIREAVSGGEASVIAGPENTYVLDGLPDQLLDGPDAVDRTQLSLAVELLTDNAAARADDEVSTALSTATPLGNLVRAATHPDPDRLPPSPPFDDEVAAWRALADTFSASVDWK